MSKQIKTKLYNFAEESIIILTMIFVFLPVRLFFYEYVSDVWLGSFGLLTTIVVTLLLLSKYNKLGWFGRAYWKTITKLHKGKRRIISYFVVGFTLYMWGSIVFGINYAIDNQDVIDVKNQSMRSLTDLEKQKLDDIQNAIEDKDIMKTKQLMENQYRSIPPELFVVAVLILLFLPILNIVAWSAMVSLLDGWFNGWFLHFGTVFFIEALEIAGIMIFTYIHSRNRDIQPNK